MRSGSRGLDCRSFHFSHAPVLIVGSIANLFIRTWTFTSFVGSVPSVNSYLDGVVDSV